MQILIRSAKIIDSSSSHNGKNVDVLITDGVISEIGTGIDSTGIDEIIEGDDLHLSQGWVDMYATIGDPGNEHKETVKTALNAAAQGGFTHIAVSPEASPAIDSKSAIEYLLNQAEGHATNLLPIGAATKKLEGSELAEMFDMKQSGAVALGNGKHSISNGQIQNLLLLYIKNLDLPLYSYCEDKDFADGGQMHEGSVNTSLGLKGIPALAEELLVARDIFLAEYTDSKIHFSHITTKGAVELIRQAKARGTKVTASVPVNHLLLTDKEIEGFDSNYKLSPPLRNQEHIDALIEGLKDGTIDAIISDHEPHEVEAKFSEFNIAESGIISFETTFSVALEALTDRLLIEEITQKLTSGPREILNLESNKIEVGSKADLTLFTPSLKWKYEKSDIKSKSQNSPYTGKELTGLPVAVINNGKLYLNS